ncbi:sensor histidine kinase [Streptomyces sp. NBC_01217]|uniref:sensor histidine kinase n=1 Tax=Streptomyces sp. NBC_01217 TaxID=2903779 RepID=UPI002E0E76DE|nr:HAMP domain-containing histidine kinase [Streptomyces sp. NBC_01217]
MSMDESPEEEIRPDGRGLGDESRQPLEVLMHELRTSLTTIRGWADLPLQDLSDEPELMVRALRRIRDEADHMHQAVQNVFPRRHSFWPRPLDPKPMNLGDLADEVVADLRLAHPERLITRETFGRTVIVADRRMLRHAVRNLLGNALRHTPAGSPVTVTVRGPSADAAGRSLVSLSVRDQGAGLSPRDIARLTAPRSEYDRLELNGGLGLSIVRLVVDLHGGELSAESELGRGTVVTMAVPTVSVPSDT